eukprot:CAMPEP_0181341274 /NCGR_PEP_ID=MMETSP1101-20121128/30314_1 /TAXON_ID=46948 /ORGANISM="Rhodomonas abbreviata, Strain Caron Lab Isolate" /LENGTH=354 /DNA_ID=CAMNT_0023452523 /DNA_START=536 /DNA_END=1601 /DNA_ORIENTATION=+
MTSTAAPSLRRREQAATSLPSPDRSSRGPHANATRGTGGPTEWLPQQDQQTQHQGLSVVSGVLEMQMHFQCKCKQFELPGTTAHHNIAKAVISALKEKEEGWKFWYETPFSALPWHFQWASSREARKQNDADPMESSEKEQQLYFLEFARSMDQGDSLMASVQRKGHQYDAAVAAIEHGQHTAAGRATPVRVVDTIPLVCGVRGSVDYDNLAMHLIPFLLKKKDKVLAAGVRAAVEGVEAMTDARQAALEMGSIEDGQCCRLHGNEVLHLHGSAGVRRGSQAADQGKWARTQGAAHAGPGGVARATTGGVEHGEMTLMLEHLTDGVSSHLGDGSGDAANSSEDKTARSCPTPRL